MTDRTKEESEKKITKIKGVEEKKANQENEEGKPKKEKKLIRRRKIRKEDPISAALHLLVKSGTIEFGSRRGLKNALSKKTKAFIVSRNVPFDIKNKILKYCNTNNILLIEFSGSSIELGSACGKPFPVSVISIFNVGNSNIIELFNKKVKSLELNA